MRYHRCDPRSDEQCPECYERQLDEERSAEAASIRGHWLHVRRLARLIPSTLGTEIDAVAVAALDLLDNAERVTATGIRLPDGVFRIVPDPAPPACGGVEHYPPWNDDEEETDAEP